MRVHVTPNTKAASCRSPYIPLHIYLSTHTQTHTHTPHTHTHTHTHTHMEDARRKTRRGGEEEGRKRSEDAGEEERRRSHLHLDHLIPQLHHEHLIAE